MEIARLLHAFGGPILSFMGAIPAMRHLPLRAFVARPGTTNVDFSGRHKAVDTYRPAPDEILSGDPLQTATYVFVSPDKMFAAGIWTCQPGKFRIDFPRDEFIHLLEGVVTVTDAAGSAKTYRAGDAFVTPKGFSGTWDVIEPVKKHFTLYGLAP